MSSENGTSIYLLEFTASYRLTAKTRRKQKLMTGERVTSDTPQAAYASAEEAQRWFLEMLFGGKPDDALILIWTLPSKRSRWCRALKAAQRAIETSRGSDVYFGVGLSTQDFGTDRRCPSEHIAGITCVWADIDIRSAAHNNKPLPASVEEALSILPEDLPASIVVHTGNGLHVYWLLREPWMFEADEERNRAAAIVYRLQTLLRTRAASRGWSFDRLADLARVLRIAGTSNCKEPDDPKPVSVQSCSDRRYNIGDLEEYLDEAGIPVSAEVDPAAGWARKFSAGQIVIDPNAAIPEELLNKWMSADARFRDTWQRNRTDLKDPSQSGYDMALANFGLRVGLTEQQIVDMITHHRRIHGQRPRTRVDYFQHTLRNATAGHGPHDPKFEAGVHHSQGDQHVCSDRLQPPSDPLVKKALLWEQLSSALGVQIIRIVKISGKEPTYQVELQNGKVEFSNIGKLIDQRKFRLAIASAADHLIPKFPGKLWDSVTRAMLDSLHVEDGGQETDFVGAARIYIDQYLSETTFIPAIEGEPSQTSRRPTLIRGKVAISSIELQQHINRLNSLNLSVKDVASMLTAVGAISERVRGPGIKEQSRWLLPVNDFDPNDYAERNEEEACGN